MAQIFRRLQQSFYFFAAQDPRQLSFPAWKRNAFDRDLPVQRVGIQESQCADRLNIGGRRHVLLLHQEQLIAANVLGVELVGWPAEVPGKLGNRVQINPDRRRRELADLEILQHPLSQWGHRNLLL